MGKAMNAIKAILFKPGELAEVVEVVADGGAFRGLLGCEDLGFYTFRWPTETPTTGSVTERLFGLVCDDTTHQQIEKPPVCRVIVGPRYAGWPIRGAFLVTRIEWEEHTSVRSWDLAHVAAQFREPEAEE
jgi:hypothetical protein